MVFHSGLEAVGSFPGPWSLLQWNERIKCDSQGHRSNVSLLILCHDIVIYKVHTPNQVTENWKKNISCLEYTFMILCWATSVAVPGPVQPTGHELDMEACRRTRYRHKPTQAQEYTESYTNYVGWRSSIEESSLDGTDDGKEEWRSSDDLSVATEWTEGQMPDPVFPAPCLSLVPRLSEPAQSPVLVLKTPSRLSILVFYYCDKIPRQLIEEKGCLCFIVSESLESMTIMARGMTAGRQA